MLQVPSIDPDHLVGILGVGGSFLCQAPVAYLLFLRGCPVRAFKGSPVPAFPPSSWRSTVPAFSSKFRYLLFFDILATAFLESDKAVSYDLLQSRMSQPESPKRCVGRISHNNLKSCPNVPDLKGCSARQTMRESHPHHFHHPHPPPSHHHHPPPPHRQVKQVVQGGD